MNTLISFLTFASVAYLVWLTVLIVSLLIIFRVQPKAIDFEQPVLVLFCVIFLLWRVFG